LLQCGKEFHNIVRCSEALQTHFIGMKTDTIDLDRPISPAKAIAALVLGGVLSVAGIAAAFTATASVPVLSSQYCVLQGPSPAGQAAPYCLARYAVLPQSTSSFC
jgi:hypothetical protein